MTVEAMKKTLYNAGDIAGTKNRRSPLSMPIMAAATAISMRNGMFTWVNSTVSCELVRECRRNPSA